MRAGMSKRMARRSPQVSRGSSVKTARKKAKVTQRILDAIDGKTAKGAKKPVGEA